MTFNESVKGTIYQYDYTVTFVSEGFRFVFVKSGDSDTILPIKPDSCGYLWGVLDDGRVIAIYIKNDFNIKNSTIVNTWNYIVFNKSLGIDNIELDDYSNIFDGISFYNGGIRSINPCNDIRRDYDAENMLKNMLSQDSYKENEYHFVFKAVPSEKKFDLELDEKIVFKFLSRISESYSVDHGTALKNDTSVLEIQFEKMKSLQAFYDYYGYITTMVSFMTYRKNISFDKIMLTTKGQYGPENIAQCYVNTDEESLRSMVNSISVYLLSDEIFENLMKCIILQDRKHKDLPISIIPISDSDCTIVTIDKIRSVCSMLEVELEAAKIAASKSESLTSLIKDVNELIKNHRDGDNKLPSKTYDNIFSSISHWGDSLADKTIIAWNMYEDIIAPVIYSFYDISINEEMIIKFVKTRNDITHRGFKEIDIDIANTYYAMTCLVYSMALCRIGMDNDIIKDLLSRRFID